MREPKPKPKWTDKKGMFITQWRRFAKERRDQEWVPLHKLRGYELDWAIPDLKVAVEIDGGTRGFTQVLKNGTTVFRQTGGHNSGAGYEHDRWRDLSLAADGWVTLRLTTQMLEDAGDPINAVEKVAQVISLREESLSVQSDR